MQYSICHQILETNSGIVFLAQEKNLDTSKKYYAFKFSSQQNPEDYLQDQIKTLKKSERLDLFRNYIKMHLDGQNQLYLFHYNEGNQFLDQKVKEYFKLKKSFSYVEIQSYLRNLLVALYELHSKQIPGRVFSTFNIVVEPGEKLVLMDFGFEPEIEQNHLDILAPPEYLKKIIEKKNCNKSDITFDLKFDSWLVGAFLYRLIKHSSINQVKVNNIDIRYKYDKKEEFYEYLKGIDFIPCQTSRYKNTLLSLVQDLLTCDPNKRLSFYQIYQHQYIQDLKLKGQQQYIAFYNQCEKIEDLKNKIIDTGSFCQNSKEGISTIQFPQKIELIYSYNNLSLQEEQNKKKIEIISITPSNIKKTNQPDYLVVVMKTPKFSNPSYYDYWFQIQLDCLRCCLLAYAADRITIFQKYENPFEQEFEYTIKKMHLLILKEINNYLKLKPQQIFLNEYQKDLIAHEQMNLYQMELEQQLTNLKQQCEIKRKQDSPLSKIIMQLLKDDKSQDPYDYFLNGYADVIQVVYQHINQLITGNQQQNVEELQAYKKLIYFCVDINISFQSKTFKEQFKQLTQNNQEVQPKDIINFLGIINKSG